MATLQTETASRSQIISNEMIANIPTQGRNPFQIMWAAPGVFKSGGWRYLRSFDIGGTTGFSANGGRVRFTVPMYYLIGFMLTFVVGGLTGSYDIQCADADPHSDLFEIQRVAAPWPRAAVLHLDGTRRTGPGTKTRLACADHKKGFVGSPLLGSGIGAELLPDP